MLENIVLKVEYMFRMLEGKPSLVILDSINSMAMNNATNLLSEFVQVLSTMIKSKGAYIVILSVEEQLKPDLREMLSLGERSNRHDQMIAYYLVMRILSILNFVRFGISGL